jgi:hypothetical protein
MLKSLPLALACALVLAPSAGAGGGLFVGAAEDAARTTDPVHAQAKMTLARLAGFDAIRMTSIWSPGQAGPSSHELQVLRTAGAAAQFNGIRIVLSVYHRDQRTTPLTPAARAEFASYVATIAREVPAITDFIIGNEPNLNLFWLPQFNADGSSASPAAYLQLLAETYDAIKAVSADLNVVGGSVSPRGTDKPKGKRPTHSPTTFIPELGKAYRESGRTQPVMDAFAFHPYLIPSKLPPTFRNKARRNTTIALSDYDKLLRALATAFDGTAQPGSTLPIVYDEFGYQSQIPAEKQGAYTNLDSPAAKDAIPEALQAQYYRQALAIAQCQPNVSGMLLFHVTDESDARTWQSGVYYADDTPKSSLPAVRQAALAAREGRLARCTGKKAKKVNPVQKVEFPNVRSFAANHRVWEASVTCDRPCKFVARIVPSEPEVVVTALDLLTGQGVSVEGTAPGRRKTQLKFPPQPLSEGSYQFVVRLFDPGKPGTSVVRFSEPFQVGEPKDKGKGKDKDK